MAKTRISRILAIAMVSILLVVALGIFALAADYTYDFAVPAGDNSYKYNAQAPENGGWETNVGYVCRDLGFAGAAEGASANGTIRSDMRVTYYVPVATQQNIKNFNGVSFYIRQHNGGTVFNTPTAKFTLTLEMDNGETITKTFQYRANESVPGPSSDVLHTALFEEEIAALTGDPKLVKIIFAPYATADVNDYWTHTWFKKAADEEAGTPAVAGLTQYLFFKSFTLTQVASAPVGLAGVEDEYDGTSVLTHNGKITGLDASKTYAYAAYKGDKLASVTGVTEITGLKGGVYEVWCEAEGLNDSVKVAVVVEKNSNGGFDYETSKFTSGELTFVKAATTSADGISGRFTNAWAVPYLTGNNIVTHAKYNWMMGIYNNDSSDNAVRQNVYYTPGSFSNTPTFVYVPTLDEQFHTRDYGMYVEIYNQPSFISNDTSAIKYAFKVYTSGNDEGYLFSGFPYAENVSAAKGCYLNLSAIPGNELVTKIEAYFFYEVIGTPDCRNNQIYPSLFAFKTVDYAAEAPAPSFELVYDEGSSAFNLTGLSADKTYLFSDDGVNFTEYTGVTSIDNVPAGTYYIQIAAYDLYKSSEVATVVINGIQPPVTEVNAADGKIIGLDASKLYEYATVDATGTGAYTKVAAGSTEINVSAGLYAVRYQTQDGYFAGKAKLVLINGSNAARQTLYANGNITLQGQSDTTLGWHIGVWSSDEAKVSTYLDNLQYGYSSVGFLGGFQMQNIGNDYTAMLNALRRFKFKYGYTPEQIVAAKDLKQLCLGTGHAGAGNTPLGEDTHLEEFADTLRVYVVGGTQPYYDFTSPRASGQGGELFDTSALANAEGYVVGIEFMPYTSAAADSTMPYDDYVQNSSKGYLYPVMSNYDAYYTVDPVPALTLKAVPTEDGKYDITGLNPEIKYEWSADGVTFTPVANEALSIRVESAGTYYVRALGDSNYAASVAYPVEAIQAKAKPVITVSGSKVSGLDAGKSYEYAKANALGIGTYADIPAGTTFILPSNGLWAIREKAGDGYAASLDAFALYNTDKTQQASILPNGVSKMPAQTDTTARGWIVGEWSSDNAKTSHYTDAAMGTILIGSMSTVAADADPATLLKKLKVFNAKYAYLDNQIIDIVNLKKIDLSYGYNGGSGAPMGETSANIGTYKDTLRIHVLGGSKPFYDIKASRNLAFGAVTFDLATLDNPSGYVVGIEYIPYTTVPANMTTCGSGKYLVPTLYLYSYLTASPIYTGPLTVSAGSAEGKYVISGLNDKGTYAWSADGVDYTALKSGALSFEVEGEGTYYVKSLADDTYLESDPIEIVISGAMPATTGLTYAEGTISGLDSTKAYEYALYDLNGLQYTDVPAGATSISGITEGLWLVRVKASGSYVAGKPQYVWVKGSNYGSIAYRPSHDLTASNFNKSWWQSNQATKQYWNDKGESLRFATNWFTQSYDTRRDFSWKYALGDDEIIEADHFADFKFSFGSGSGSWTFIATSFISKVRFYIAGGVNDYYDVFVPTTKYWSTYTASLASVMPGNENGYVVGIEIWPYWEVNDYAGGENKNEYPALRLVGWTDLTPDAGLYNPDDKTNTQEWIDAQDTRYRYNVYTISRPSGLGYEYEEGTAYYKTAKITGLNASKSYEYSKDNTTFTALPAGSTEITGLIPGKYYVRYAATANDTASAATAVVIPLNVPSFGDLFTASFAGTVSQNFNEGWTTFPEKWGTEIDKRSVSHIAGNIDLSTVSFKYQFAADNLFEIGDYPYLSADYNLELVNTNHPKGFFTATAAIDIYVEGEDKPYTFEKAWAGKSIEATGFTANRIIFNVLDEYPELAGKKITAFDLKPFSDCAGMKLEDFNSESSATKYCYFRLYHIGLFDTPANALAATSETHERVNSLSGVRATTNVIYAQGAEFNPNDIKVEAVFDDGDTFPVKTGVGFDVPQGFATAAGKYTVGVSYNGYGTTVEIPVGLESLNIKTPATKTAFYSGDKLDLAGLEVEAVLADQSTIALDLDNVTIDIADKALETTDTKVTITFGGCTTSYDITVTALEVVDFAIATYPDKEGLYNEGDYVDLTGLSINVTYNSGKIVTLTEGFATAYSADTMVVGGTLTITYAGISHDYTLSVKGVEIDHIAITTPANKTEYVEGEELDTTGLEVTVYYDNGTSEVAEKFEAVADLSKVTDASGVETKTVEVTCEGFTVTYDVTVKGIDTNCSWIDALPNKLEYKVGDTLDLTGLSIFITFKTGDEEAVTEGFEVSDVDMTTAGTKSVTITYGIFSESFNIEVSEEVAPATLTGITVTAPTKVVYTVGDTLDLTGMVVTANYSDASSKDVTNDATVDVTTLNTAGNTTVTVTYEGKTDTFDVTVNAAVQPDIASGTAGDLTWKITADGELIVSGNGAMPAYTKGKAPWQANVKKIFKVTVEEGVTSIGDYAFYNLTKLTTTTFTAPSTVKHVGDLAFRDSYFTSISLPNVEKLNANALKTIPYLTDVTIGESLNNITGDPFSGTFTLHAPTNSYAAMMAKYLTENGKTTATITVDESGTVAQPVLEFGMNGDYIYYAIYHVSTNKNGTLNAKVVFGGVGKMKNYPYVVDAQDPRLLSGEVESSPIFKSSHKNEIKEGVLLEGIDNVGNYAFFMCSKMETITLPSTVTGIGFGSFRGCSKLNNVVLPEALTRLGQTAFNGCSALTSITIGPNVNDIQGENVFVKCNAGLVVTTNCQMVIDYCNRKGYGVKSN